MNKKKEGHVQVQQNAPSHYYKTHLLFKYTVNLRKTGLCNHETQIANVQLLVSRNSIAFRVNCICKNPVALLQFKRTK